MDTTGFIVTKFTSEITEFTVQSIALLIYNGFNPFDPNNENDVYLAEKPGAIAVFALILSMNMFGSGFLWSLYTLFPAKIYGLVFKRAMFFVDKMRYSMYPIFKF